MQPIIHLPTLESKIDFIRYANSIGYMWYDDVEYSIQRIKVWRGNNRDYGSLHTINAYPQGTVKIINWFENSKLNYLLNTDKDVGCSFTLLNSLSHLKHYMLKNKV